MPKPRILLVDDDAAILQVTALSLRLRYEVRTECRPELVLAVLQEFEPDLLILDVIMPGISGVQIARQVRQEPRFSGQSILFITGSTLALEVPGPVLTKPFRSAELLAKVEAVLADRAPAPAQ